jgi:hypothetical protein
MIYAQLDTTDQIVETYPLTIFQIRALYPSVSWSDEPDQEALAEYHLVVVEEIDPPAPIKKKFIVVEGLPAQDPEDELWYQVWIQQLKKTKKIKK